MNMRVISRSNRIFIVFVDILLWVATLPWRMTERRNTTSGVRKILVMELWGIGDLVMMSAVIAPLREAYPDAEICLLSKAYGKELFCPGQAFDRYFIFDFPWTKFRGKYKLWQWDWQRMSGLIETLRREKFDVILDARGDVRNNVLSLLTGGQRRIGYGWTGGACLLTDLGEDPLRKRHRVEAWQALLNRLGIDAAGSCPRLATDAEADVKADTFLKQAGYAPDDFIIGIHPGARMAVRRWPLDRFLESARQIEKKFGGRIVFFKDPDIDIKAINAFPVFEGGLSDLVAMITRVKVFICNDTGVMHIATAVGTPVIAVFGPGEVETIGPYGPGHTVVRKDNVDCRPCWDYCRCGEPYCLRDIRPEDVVGAVEKLWHK